MTTPDTRIAAPHRTCIGCRQSRPQSELVRCTIGSTDGSPQCAHVSRTAPGRGAWLCSMNCYQTAVQRKAFDRSWKRSVPAETLLVLADSLRAVFDPDVNYIAVKEIDMKESSIVGIVSDDLAPRKG